MPLLDHEIARREGQDLLVRSSPVRLRWELNDLISSDGHRLRCIFTCSLRALEQPAERKMLEEVFLASRAAATMDDVANHFRGALSAAAARIASAHAVAEWLADQAKPAMIGALRQAANATAFACGLEMLPPFHLDVESPSFQQQRIEAMTRQLAEQRTAGQVEHFQRAVELLRQFQTMREHAPQLTAGRVLEQISPADRGMMLQSLLMAAAGQSTTQDLWAVAGPSLVRIDTHSDPPTPQCFDLPETLGPLRSVQAAQIDGRHMLLVGARCGVMIVDPADTAKAVPYMDAQVTSLLGFSRAVSWGDQLFACHGEAGIVGWRLGENAAPHLAFRPAQLVNADNLPTDAATATDLPSPRHLQVLDGSRLIFADGPRLLTINHAGAVESLLLEPRGQIIGIIPEERSLLIVHEDGQIIRRDRATLEATGIERYSGRVGAAGALPWLGSVRLLLASEDGPIYCIGLEDDLVTQYSSPHRALRIVAGAADRIAAVSSDRQRLILWPSWDGRRPVAEIHLASLTRHRIADITFA